MDEDDTAKDASVAVVAASAAALSLTGPAGAAVAAIGGLVSIAWNKIGGRNQRKAESLFLKMAQADPDPSEFIQQLHRRLEADDEEVFVALRGLLNAALDAVSPASLEAIALVGREYLRARCSAAIARGWVKLISEVTTQELAALREVAAAAIVAREIDGDIRSRAPIFRPSGRPRGVALLLSDQRPGQPKTLNAIPALLGRGAKPAAAGHAERLFDLMLRHGVASDRDGIVASLRTSKVNPETRPAVELDHEAVKVLVLAMGLSLSQPKTSP